MRKLSAAVTLTLTAMLLSSCSLGETTVPVIASHSGDDTIDESDSRFFELTKPKNESSICIPQEEFSVVQNESVEEISEETSEPQKRYSYNKFIINGFPEEEISDIVACLTDIVDSAGAHISIYYEDVVTGNSFSYDGARLYKAGSVTMAPYARYLIGNGENLEETLTLKAYHKQSGSGTLKNASAGTEYTVVPGERGSYTG